MFREPAPRLNVQAPSEPFSANIYTHQKYHLLSQTLHLLSFAELFSTKTTTPSLSASSSRLETATVLFSHFRISAFPSVRSSDPPILKPHLLRLHLSNSHLHPHYEARIHPPFPSGVLGHSNPSQLEVEGQYCILEQQTGGQVNLTNVH